MTGFLSFIAVCLGYYFFTRFICILYVIMVGSFGPFNSWQEMLDGSSSNKDAVSIVVPLFGDCIFFAVSFFIIFYHPLEIFGNLISSIQSRIQHHQEVKQAKLKYLKSLSDFGLTPKDIPKYISDTKSLEEYLKIWNQATAENKRIKNGAN